MNVEAVTTFNEKGLRMYGMRMIHTFDHHWSCGVPLIVYNEGWTPHRYGLPDYPLVSYRDLVQSSDWLADFKLRHAHRRSTGYRMDVVRFSHKIAALLHVLENTSADYVIWLDGDIVTHADFDEEHLRALLPVDTWIAWLDRSMTHPECGFYILNTKHEAHATMVKQLRAMYADDLFLNEKEWHDSYLLQQLVLRNGLVPRSLSGEVAFRTHHPLVNSPLGKWFDHLKGNRKVHGRSGRCDLHVKREERYWR